jgi:hypothetical protein
LRERTLKELIQALSSLDLAHKETFTDDDLLKILTSLRYLPPKSTKMDKESSLLWLTSWANAGRDKRALADLLYQI